MLTLVFSTFATVQGATNTDHVPDTYSWMFMNSDTTGGISYSVSTLNQLIWGSDSSLVGSYGPNADNSVMGSPMTEQHGIAHCQFGTNASSATHFLYSAGKNGNGGTLTEWQLNWALSSSADYQVSVTNRRQLYPGLGTNAANYEPWGVTCTATGVFWTDFGRDRIKYSPFTAAGFTNEGGNNWCRSNGGNSCSGSTCYTDEARGITHYDNQLYWAANRNSFSSVYRKAVGAVTSDSSQDDQCAVSAPSVVKTMSSQVYDMILVNWGADFMFYTKGADELKVIDVAVSGTSYEVVDLGTRTAGAGIVSVERSSNYIYFPDKNSDRVHSINGYIAVSGHTLEDQDITPSTERSNIGEIAGIDVYFVGSGSSIKPSGIATTLVAGAIVALIA